MRLSNNTADLTTPTIVDLAKLPEGAVVDVETENRTYRLRTLREDTVFISGHPRHCPDPVIVRLCSIGGVFDPTVLWEGMHIEYEHPSRGVVRTSAVVKLHVVHTPALTSDRKKRQMANADAALFRRSSDVIPSVR